MYFTKLVTLKNFLSNGFNFSKTKVRCLIYVLYLSEFVDCGVTNTYENNVCGSSHNLNLHEKNESLNNKTTRTKQKKISSFKRLRKKINEVITTNDTMILVAKQTFETLQEQLQLVVEQRTKDNGFYFPDNLAIGKEEVRNAKRKILDVETAVFETMNTLILFEEKQENDDEKILFDEKTKEAIEEIIELKAKILGRSLDDFGALKALQQLSDGVKKLKYTHSVKLEMAVFEILDMKEEAVETTKAGIDTLEKFIEDQEINFGNERGTLSFTELQKMNDISKFNDKALKITKNTLSDLKRLFQIEKEQLEEEKKIILSHEKLIKIVRKIEETSFKVENIVKTIFYGIKRLVYNVKKQEKKQRNTFLLKKLESLEKEIIEIWLDSVRRSLIILGILNDLSLEETEKKACLFKLLGKSLNEVKETRKKIGETARITIEHLKKQELNDLHKKQDSNKEELENSGVKILETKKEATNLAKLILTALKGLVLTEEIQQIKLKKTHDSAIQNLSDLKDLVTISLKVDALDSIEEVKSVFNSMFYMIMETSMKALIKRNTYLKPTEAAQNNNVDNELKNLSEATITIFKKVPEIKESAKEAVDEALKKFIGMACKNLQLTMELFTLEEYANKVIIAWKKILGVQISKKVILRSTRAVLISLTEKIEIIRTQMIDILNDFKNEYKITKVSKKDSFREDVTMKVQDGKGTLAILDELSMILLKLALEMKNLLVEKVKETKTTETSKLETNKSCKSRKMKINEF